MFAYRMGGDEFMVLFVHCGETEISQALVSLTDEMHRMGRSISIGVAVRQGPNDTLEELIRTSDMRMYEDKRNYYQSHDRRRRN